MAMTTPKRLALNLPDLDSVTYSAAATDCLAYSGFSVTFDGRFNGGTAAGTASPGKSLVGQVAAGNGVAVRLSMALPWAVSPSTVRWQHHRPFVQVRVVLGRDS
jgi:hypothetical protein